MPADGPLTALAQPFDVEAVRRVFPGLHQEVRGKPLVYLDSAATAQRPQPVIDAVVRAMGVDNANVNRGVHAISERATSAYEGARETIGRFLGAPDPDKVVFVRGTTEAINLAAESLVRPRLDKGGTILLTEMEHHSNIVPWQRLAKRTGASITVAPILDDGSLDLDALWSLIEARPAAVSLTHVSNVLGTVNPIREVVRRAHAEDVPVIVDGAQAAPHLPVDLASLGADLYAVSGHKMCGPTGIGVLAGRTEVLESMEPWQGGGDMIRRVSWDETTYAPVPHKFEAGTPNVAGAIGLGAAATYLDTLGMDRVHAYEQELLKHVTEALGAIEGLVIQGTTPDKAAVLSFTIDGVHPHDLGTALDLEGIAVRAGHHCAQPLMERLGVPATVRASLAFYNTVGELDRLAAVVRDAVEVLR